jgi:hypothetical protein
MHSWIPENTWISEACDVLKLAAQQPATTMDWILFALAWLIGGLSMMKVMATLLGNTNESTGSSLLILILGWGVALAAAGAAAFWWVPQAGSAEWGPWLPAIAAGLALLVIVIPVHKMIQRTSFGAAFLSLLAAILVASLLHLLFRTVADGLQKGRIQFEFLDKRTESINQGPK